MSLNSENNECKYFKEQKPKGLTNINSHRTYSIDDVTQDDFRTLTEKQAFNVLRNTFVKLKTSKDSVRESNIKLRIKLSQLRRYLDAFVSKCNIADLHNQVLHSTISILGDMNKYVNGTRNKRTTENFKAELVNDGVLCEKVCVVTDYSYSTNPVQFKASDAVKEAVLKRKLKQLVENHVIKSKKIRELNNVILTKNNFISEIRKKIGEMHVKAKS